MHFPHPHQGVAVPGEENIDVVYDLSSANYLQPSSLSVPEPGSRVSMAADHAPVERRPSVYFNYAQPQVGVAFRQRYVFTRR